MRAAILAVAVVVGLTLAMSGCILEDWFGDESTATDYAVGDKWTFTTEGGEGTYEVIETGAKCNGYDVTVFKMAMDKETTEDGVTETTHTEGTFYMAWFMMPVKSVMTSSITTSMALMTYNMTMEGTMEVEFDSLFPEDFEDGTNWTIESTESSDIAMYLEGELFMNDTDEQTTTTTYTVMGEEEVTVAAGTFTCIKIKSQDSGSEDVSYMYYCPEVRMFVKSVSINDGVETVMELKSYSLG